MVRVIKGIFKFVWNFLLLISVIVNLVLIGIVIFLGATIFDINRNIITPLVEGLHSSFVGLDAATIDWTIPVRDTVPVQFTLPLVQDTVVVLTEPVPLVVGASISAPGLQISNVTVFLELPRGLELPVALNLDVPVDTDLDIALDVRAVIPLSQTQLHDPFQNLRLLFEPIIRALYNLPTDYNSTAQLVTDALNGEPIDLLAENAYSRSPWVGFSRTAGVDYTLAAVPAPPQNVARQTGIVVPGGIPALDAQLRPEVYAAGGPDAVNAQALDSMQGQSLRQLHFDGSYFAQVQSGGLGIDFNNAIAPGDLGILPTPVPATGGG